MWRGSEYWLACYGFNICYEWISQGYNDSLLPFFKQNIVKLSELKNENYPKWLGDLKFHRSHQSNLIRKDPTFYGHKFPNVPDDLPYEWPQGLK